MPFEILQDRNGDLMHNKFIIIDAGEDESYTVTGSMNFTSGQMTSDPNHLHIIKDKALALAYEMEFEEMWGSDTENYDLTQSRFGDQKGDNTPHEFQLGDVRAELYFSPSDKTSQQIEFALATSQHNIDLGLLIFTYWDLRDQLLRQLDNGVRVRGIIEDDDNSFAVVSQLNANGGRLKFDNQGHIYHHKMAIIDGTYPDSNPTLISGSHNWTYTAENFNDENTLIFFDKDLAELFSRAFNVFWKDLSTSTTEEEVKNNFIYPNPASDKLYFTQSATGSTSLTDISGKVIKKIYCSSCTHIDISDLAPGIYYIRSDDPKLSGLNFVKN